MPPHADSPLARLDARWRLLALLAVAACVCMLRTAWGAGAALACGIALAWTAHVPWGWMAARLAVLGLVLALFAMPVAFVAGIEPSAVIVARGLALALVAAALVVAAPLDRTFRAAARLGVPGVAVHVALLAYRYLFLIGDELARLRTALRVRGFRNRASGHAWSTVAAATGTLLVRGSDRAGRVAAAMRCRGFDGAFRGLDEARTRWRDVAGFVAIVGIGACLVALDRCAA